jgi:hypothetical protein
MTIITFKAVYSIQRDPCLCDSEKRMCKAFLPPCKIRNGGGDEAYGKFNFTTLKKLGYLYS